MSRRLSVPFRTTLDPRSQTTTSLSRTDLRARLHVFWVVCHRRRVDEGQRDLADTSGAQVLCQAPKLDGHKPFDGKGGLYLRRGFRGDANLTVRLSRRNGAANFATSDAAVRIAIPFAGQMTDSGVNSSARPPPAALPSCTIVACNFGPSVESRTSTGQTCCRCSNITRASGGLPSPVTRAMRKVERTHERRSGDGHLPRTRAAVRIADDLHRVPHMKTRHF